MRIWKRRLEHIPRSIEKRVRDLRKRMVPEPSTAWLSQDIGRKLKTLGKKADPSGSIDAYVLAHKAEWLLQAKAWHNELLDEIGSLTAEASALVAHRRVLCEHERDVMDDVDAAVAHALERVTDPDSPYHEPIRRSERKGGKR